VAAGALYDDDDDDDDDGDDDDDDEESGIFLLLLLPLLLLLSRTQCTRLLLTHLQTLLILNEIGQTDCCPPVAPIGRHIITNASARASVDDDMMTRSIIRAVVRL